MRKIESIEKRNSAQFAAVCQEILRSGHHLRFRATGASMRPNISNGDTVLIAPATAAEVVRGDVVLTNQEERMTLHRVVSFESSGAKIATRGDSGQQNDSPTGNVLGKLIAIRNAEKEIPVSSATPYFHAARSFLHRLRLAAKRRLLAHSSSFLLFLVIAGLGSLFAATPAAAQADLAITVDTAAPTTVAPGGQITYTVTVINNGPNTATNPVVSMNTPSSGGFNTTFVSASRTGGNGTWTLGGPAVGSSGLINLTRTTNMNNGSTATFTIVVMVPAGVPNGTVFTNSVNISSVTGDPNGANNTASVSITVQILTITDSAAPTTAAPGQNITFTQVLTNTSGLAVTHPLTVSQNLPANTTFVSAARTAGTDTWACALNTGVITCTDTSGGTYAAAASTTFSIVVTVNTGVSNGTVIADTVSAQGANSGSAATATATATVVIPDLSVTESAAPNPVATGTNITYTETVTNNSAPSSAGATLTQSTPPNTHFVSVTPPAGWTCGTTPAVGANGSIICTVTGSLAGNSSVVFTVVVSVSPEAPGGSTIANSVTVSETLTDPVPGNNTATASVTVQGADLGMTQSASTAASAPSPATAVAPGATITYTETVINNGPIAAVTAVLYQQTPLNTTFTSITPPAGWTCITPGVGATGQVICTDGSNLNVGGSAATFTYVVTVNGGTAAGTVITNPADVTSQTSDPVASNNTTITNVLAEVTADADLGVSITAAPTPVFVSSPITYTIQVVNRGLAAGSNVTVVDTLPAALIGASATTTQGSCLAPSAGTITCNLGTVAYPLATPIVITITGTTPSTATTLNNSATVSTTSTDPVAANNTATALTVVQPLVCASPGKDGAGGAIAGIVDAYYPPSSAGTVAAGATSISLGAAAAGGAQTAIGLGDLLLVIQMQAAQINSSNTTSYGAGTPGQPSGYTSLGASGEFEFVTATNAVPVTGGTLNFLGTGSGTGLLNSYTSGVASTTQGIRTFQVIRVPQYSSATLSPGLTALPWNGATGGVLALDIASQLTLAGTVVLDGLGFRGGGGVTATGLSTGLRTDTVTVSPATLPNLSGGGDPVPAGNGANGAKGEGIAGTPHWVAPAIRSIVPTSTAISSGQAIVEGLPNGSQARGAPANAGGGGGDANPVANDQNTGGGAGGNGGTGGTGGFAWNSVGLTGGYGGVNFPFSTSLIVMGGGGGAGTTNNGTFWNPSTDTGQNDCGLNCTGVYSSGAAGGAIVIIHAGSAVGSGTITSNGTSALAAENDGAGGGGAGGTILFLANSGSLSGLTATAIGGNGGSTWPAQIPAAFPGNRHGPGGGGGGGVIITSSTPGASSSVAGGLPGTSTLANDPYGATVGQPGVFANAILITENPGTQAGAYCAGADLSVANFGTPNPVIPGGTITYTQTVANAGPLDALNAVFSESIPANTTFSSVTPPSGWTCNSNASILSTGVISCTNPDVPSGAAGNGIFTVNVVVNAAAVFGSQIVDVDSVTSGTNDPNLANNTAISSIIVGSASSMALTLSKTPTSSTVQAGNNITWNMVIDNGGPGVSNAGVFDTVPANTSFVSITAPAGWACSAPPVNATSGNISCTTPSLAVNAPATITLVVTVLAGTANGTTINNTANANGGLPNPNPNVATAVSNVLVAGANQADFTVTTSASPNPVLVANNITYAQTVTNNGPATASTLTFTDVIPAGTTFVSIPTPPPGWSCTTPALGATGTVTCTIAALVSGGTASFPLIVKVDATTTPGTTISNSPNIASTTSDPNGPNDPNNTATSTTIVASPSQADVTITKTAAPEPVDLNANLTYTIQVTNNGPAVATGVSVSDPLPGEVTFASVSSSQGTCTQAAGTVSCTIGTLGVGGTAVITINTTASTFSSSAVNCPPTSSNQFNACNGATLTTTSSNPNGDLSTTGNPVTAFAGSTIQATTAVQLSSFQAQGRPQGGVLLEWHTREEIRNLGFNIYREDAQGRRKVNPSLIAGGALFVRGGRPQHSAKTYQWLDAAGSSAATYWLEDVDLNGTRTMHGPVQVAALSASPAASSAALSPTANATLLTQLNRSVRVSTANSGVRPMTPRPSIPILSPREYRASLEDTPAVKIAVSNEGWYRVSGAQLIAAGFDANASVRELQLYAEGIEQPLLLSGQQTGSLRSLDGIEFYGTGIDTPYSGERIYWLVQSSRPGTRILSVPARASGSSMPESFSFTTIHEDRTTYFATLLNGEDHDNFFGDAVTSEPVDESLTVANSDPGSGIPISVDVILQGATDQQNHSVSVQFNGASIGEMDFYGLANVTNTFPIDPSLLQDGINTVTLTALQGDNDVSLVQSVALHYPHKYLADANWLRASAPAGTALHISGFTSGRIRVFDITNPQSIEELNGKVALEGAAYGVNFATTNSGPAQRTLLAFCEDQVSAPDSLAYHQPSMLAQNPRPTDIVMIAHPDFVANLAPLARLHESEGRSVTIITVDSIFDAFNFGERSPYAVRSYLQSLTLNAARKPQAVLLVGDASLDPRNYLGFGDFDFVPTRIIETQAFKTASDDWFTDFQKTGFATIPTGRIPVRTTADADLVISKIVGYENGSSAGSWNRQAIMVSDENAGVDFTVESQYAISNLPSSLQPVQIVADGIDPATARQQILAELNNGALLVNYSGHGATEQWSFADLFDNTDAAALVNGDRLPFYLLMDCLNGFFHDVYSQSLAESLLLAPNGGAVAVWASSGFTTSPPQATMNQAMLHALQVSPSLPIGAAALHAKLGITDPDVRRTWILFGDPAMKLQLSAPPNGRRLPAPPNPPSLPGFGPLRSCPRCPISYQPAN